MASVSVEMIIMVAEIAIIIFVVTMAIGLVSLIIKKYRKK
jgi:hypothetical protein